MAIKRPKYLTITQQAIWDIQAEEDKRFFELLDKTLKQIKLERAKVNDLGCMAETIGELEVVPPSYRWRKL